jgi:type IV secretory pathway TraG/TraD family ATPase VirD4
MEHLLRYAMLALLEFPKADLRDIIRLFIEKEFRQVIISRIRDPQVRQFWTLEYPNMNYKTAIDGVAPIANKLGAFLAHPIVRKAVCEPQKPLRFRRVMDEGGRLVINLAKGALGADTANVLGGLLVSSLMHAAFTRQETTEGERRPFMLYVDEFHSFSSTAFASMLSETRKYGLGLTMAHQHTQQADAAVIEAVLGNVGSLMTFRLGVSDAPLFQRQLGNVSVSDLISLPNYRAYVQLMVDGQRSRTFSAESLPGI